MGEQNVPKIAGGILSFLTVILMLVYSLTKLLQLIKRHNPQVASLEELSALDSSFIFNFKERGVRFAFGVEGNRDKETKDDSRYVKGLVRL